MKTDERLIFSRWRVIEDDAENVNTASHKKLEEVN